MTFNYSRTADTALRLLQKFGRSVTLRHYTIGAYDAELGVAAQTSADTTRTAALFDFGAGQTRGPGGLIQGGDKRILMDASGAAPALEDHIIVGSVTYTLKGVGEISPSGLPVIYDLHVSS